MIGTMITRISTCIPFYALAFILLLGNTGLAVAEDFTFNVPVAFYNMSAYTAARVACNALGPATTVSIRGVQSVQLNPVGGNYTELPISNGTYVGTVTVKFNAGVGINPASAIDWSCRLMFLDKYLNEWGPPWGLVPGRTSTPQAAVGYDRSKPYKVDDQGYFK